MYAINYQNKLKELEIIQRQLDTVIILIIY